MKMHPVHRKRLRWLWAVAVVTVIVGSLLPGSSLPMTALDQFHVNDKVLHFLAYAVLVFLPALHERRGMVALLTVGVIGLGVLLEFAQNYSPGRTFEVADMVADGAGALCGLVLGRWDEALPSAARLRRNLEL